MPEAVIVSAVRSPIGRAHKGSLTSVRADDLASQMITAALEKIPALDPNTIDDLILGCGIPENEAGSNLARIVGIKAGLDAVPATTVTRFCASSVQSTRMAFHAIRAGEGAVFISAGVESTSRMGRGRSEEDIRDPALRSGWERTERRAAGKIGGWHDPRMDGELPDVYIPMGQTAENVAEYRGVSRTDADAWALLSQTRSAAAAASGVWAREITPVALADGSLVSSDDSPRPTTTASALASLEPVFRPNGIVTAGNACPLNDGAAALIIMSDTRATELGLKPLARIRATGVSALSPEIMGLGPVEASRRALRNAGLSAGDIDLWEINEAFAAQVLPSVEDLGIDHDRLNVHGGAIALGHPFGMTGARITSTLLNAMEARDATFGVETMCVGGGQGMAIVLERV